MVELRFIPAPEAAVAASISRERIIRLVQRGEINGRLVSGRWQVAEGEVERLRQRAAQAADT